MKIKMLKGVMVQTENGVVPAEAGTIVDVADRCAKVLLFDGRAEIVMDDEPVKVEHRERPIKKKLSKR